MSRTLGIAILTISDRSSRGEREDRGGPAIREALAAASTDLQVDERAYLVVADDQTAIADAIRALCARPDVDVLLTTGGTGLAPRDVTPQATRAVLEYEVPGIAEALRAESLRVTPFAMLARGLAGVRERTLVVNLPGSPKAVRETVAVLAPVLEHAVSTLRGEVANHPTAG